MIFPVPQWPASLDPVLPRAIQLLLRRPHATDRRTKVVKLTDRGWGALEVIRRVAVELEQSWADALGEELYRSVRQGLASLERALEESMTPGSAPRDGGGDRRTASGPAH